MVRIVKKFEGKVTKPILSKGKYLAIGVTFAK